MISVVAPKLYTLPRSNNWGDIFAAYLFKNRFGLDMQQDDCEYEDIEKDCELRSKAEVFSCGSLLERVPRGFSGHVLGSGMGYTDTRCDLKNVKAPLLLRGPLTAQRCTYQYAPRLGDPGILAYMFLTKVVPRTIKYGVIPHMMDKKNEEVANWVDRGALVIDIESGVRNVIDMIACCQKVVSSCLHGLIIADSLGIPNKYVRLSSRIDEFKFFDYYWLYDELAQPTSTIEEAFAACRTRNTEHVRNDVILSFREYVDEVSVNV